MSNSKVPFTKASRKAALSKLLSLTLYHGLPSIFFTIAPDDIQDPNRIRMSVPLKNNSDFPAEPGGFLRALQNNEHFYAQIPIQRNNLADLLVKSPIAAAEMFNMVVDTVSEVLFGISPDHKIKKSSFLCDRKPGVFGKSSASAGMPEEQGRGSLHAHFCLWSKDLSPKLLQAVGGVPGLERLVCSMIDLMIQGEISPQVHVEALVRQFTGKKAQQAAFFEPHNPKSHPTAFEADVARTINCSGIHTHNGTCRKCKAGQTGCRLGRPQPCRCCTVVTQILPVKNNKGSVSFEELSFVELASCIPESFNDSQPLGQPDNRILIWELKRPVLDVHVCLDEDSSPSRFLSFSPSRQPHVFSEETQSCLNQLEQQKFDRLVLNLKRRNGLVVEFNPLISSIFKCNTNASLLGSFSQAKSLLLYLLKYVTKAPADLTASLTILKNARIRMDHYPSQAENAGTDERTAIRYLEGVANMMIGASEYSAAMAAYAILDYPAEIYTSSFWYVYVHDAINYAKQQQPARIVRNISSEHSYASSVDEPLPQTRVDARHDHSYSSSAAQEHLNRIVREFERTESSMWGHENELLSDDENEYDSVFFNHHPTVPDDPVSSTAGSSTLSVGESHRPAAATIYKSKEGPRPVSQAVHYSYRGTKLAFYSLFEYAAIITIVEKPKENERSSGAGRKRNAVFEFAEGHPLRESHVQQIRSKLCVPTPIQKPPKPPPTKPQKHSELWEKKAERFANYMLVLFRPWAQDNGQHPGCISWNSFCDYIKELKRSITGLPSFVNQVRLCWIENAGRGMDVNADERAATIKFRHREATKWNRVDGTAVLQPGDAEYDTAAEQDEARRAASAAMIAQMRAETDILTISPSNLAADNYIADMAKNIESLLSAVPAPPFDSVENSCPLQLEKLFNTNPIVEPTSIVKTIKRAKTYNRQSLEEELNDDPLPPSNTVFTPMEATPDTSGALNVQQKKVLNECVTYFQLLSVSKISGAPPPVPPKILIHGSPGVGKSYLTHKIFEAGNQLGLEVGCCAYMGHPATNMPSGRTIHNYLGIPVFDKDDYLFDWHSPPSTQSLAETLTHFNAEKIGMIIIDEISMITPGFLANIDQKLRMLTGKFDEPFGNIAMMLMGDFYQIPPVKAKINLYAAALKKNLIDSHSDPVIHGAWLFTMFKLVELTEQMRAANDAEHIAMLNRMRNGCEGEQNITQNDLARHKYFSFEDVISDANWAEAPVVTLTNKERIFLNAIRSQHFARLSGKNRFCWYSPLNKCSAKLNDEQTSELYRQNVLLRDFFVAGAPGYLLSNINPSLGLANGTPVIYHSLILDDREDLQCIMQQNADTMQSTDVYLLHPPKYICVEVPSCDATKFEGITLVPGKVVIPIEIAKNKTKKMWKINLEGYGVIQTQTIRHDVDMKFALTAYKVNKFFCYNLL